MPNETPKIIDLINKSGLPAKTYIDQHILKPLIETYAYLTFKHGIVGEPHLQNVSFESDENGNLTGRILLKDLDAFKPDIELRHILGLADTAFLRPDRPYKLLKMAKAEEFYRISYTWYVKHNWVSNIMDTLQLYGGRLKQGANVGNLAEVIDKMLLVEAVDYLGFRAVFNSADMRHQKIVMHQEWAEGKKDPSFNKDTLKEERLKAAFGTLNEFVNLNKAKLKSILPEVNWEDPLTVNLTVAQTKTLLKNFTVSQVFLRPEANSHSTWLFDPNPMIAAKKEASKGLVAEMVKQNGIDQDTLRKEFARLNFNYRTSSQAALPKSAVFVVNYGSITAYDRNSNVLSHAFLEPRDWLSTEGPYYKNAKYPRTEPDRALLEALYNRPELRPEIHLGAVAQTTTAPVQTGEPSHPAPKVAEHGTASTHSTTAPTVEPAPVVESAKTGLSEPHLTESHAADPHSISSQPATSGLDPAQAQITVESKPAPTVKRKNIFKRCAIWLLKMTGFR